MLTKKLFQSKYLTSLHLKIFLFTMMLIFLMTAAFLVVIFASGVNAITRNLIIEVNVVAAVLIAGAGRMWAMGLIHSLTHITTALTQISKGDLSVEVKVENYDEFGLLEVAARDMVADLRNITTAINQTSSFVATSARQLTSHAAEIAAASEQIAYTVQDINLKSQEQTEQTNTVTTAVRELSVAIQHSNENVQEVSEKSNGAFQLAQDGQSSMENVVTKMDSIDRLVSNSVNTFHDLTQLSQQISSIVTVISQITSQTHLLSLNASIEAARVGEQGRGFAVVANEIKKLSEETSRSANEITHVILTMQSLVQQVAIAMDQGAQEVKEGAKVTGEAGESFKQILAAIEGVNNRVVEISSVNEQIAATSESIIPIMHALVDRSNAMGDATSTVVATTEEQTAAMSEISANAEELVVATTELQHHVTKFKL